MTPQPQGGNNSSLSDMEAMFDNLVQYLKKAPDFQTTSVKVLVDIFSKEKALLDADCRCLL